jgi:hypothetical protein
MIVAIDPVEHSVCGLAGGVHKDFRSEVVGKQELGGGWRRISPRPPSRTRRRVGCRRRQEMVREGL